MYDLSFYLSGNPDGSPTTKEVKVTATGTAGEVYSYNIGSNSEANMKYVLESYIFTATSTSTTVGFVSFDTPGAYGAVIGGVNLSATPEPGFYGVLALGLSGLFYAFLRRRRQA
jgi:MYXO-CTERM domain-containing protein